CYSFFSNRPPPSDPSTFPYTTLFRSFAVNARSAPGRILRHHLKDQIADLLGHPIPSQSPSRFGDQNSSTGENQHDASGRPSQDGDRKSTRLNSSHVAISYAVFCLKKK